MARWLSWPKIISVGDAKSPHGKNARNSPFDGHFGVFSIAVGQGQRRVHFCLRFENTMLAQNLVVSCSLFRLPISGLVRCLSMNGMPVVLKHRLAVIENLAMAGKTAVKRCGIMCRPKILRCAVSCRSVFGLFCLIAGS